MCKTCGCDVHTHDHHAVLRLEHRLLEKNDAIAAETRRVLTERGVTMFNLIGAPGAGKTALLETTIRSSGASARFAVIEGDQATDIDARRIRGTGARVHQVNTGPGCHLDARMVADALAVLAPEPGSVVFVENVGNLVCPALFDLGELAKVVVSSVTEGEDKPLKYPHVFRAAKLVVLTKADLLPHVPFQIAGWRAYARRANPTAPALLVSASTGDGVDAWHEWVGAHRLR